MHKLDLIIPVYNGGDDFIYRLRNMNIITSAIPYEVHLIIVEQVDGNETFWENLHIQRSDITYIPVEYSGVFNKGWLYNIGLKETKTENVILGESDCLFEPLYFNNILKHLKNNPPLQWFHCWDKILYLSESMDTVYKKYNNIAGGPEGGLILFKKNFLFSIGGANEWLEGLGGIDDDLVIRASYITGRQRFKMEGTIYHYWHPNSKMKGNRSDSKFFRRNRMKNVAYCNYLHKNPRLVIECLSNRIDEIGGDIPLCNKYSLPFFRNKDLSVRSNQHRVHKFKKEG